MKEQGIKERSWGERKGRTSTILRQPSDDHDRSRGKAKSGLVRREVSFRGIVKQTPSDKK